MLCSHSLPCRSPGLLSMDKYCHDFLWCGGVWSTLSSVREPLYVQRQMPHLKMTNSMPVLPLLMRLGLAVQRNKILQEKSSRNKWACHSVCCWCGQSGVVESGHCAWWAAIAKRGVCWRVYKGPVGDCLVAGILMWDGGPCRMVIRSCH